MVMKIQLVSDLHSEFWKTHDFALVDEIVPKDAKDTVLVVAGDLDNNTTRIEQWFEDVFSKYRHVIYVFGNHEYYGKMLPTMLHDVKEIAKRYRNVHVLENETFELDGVTFLGTTLWYDGTPAELHWHGFTDHTCITDEFLRPLKLQKALDMHVFAKSFLSIELERLVGKKTVVVTHHMPRLELVHEWYRYSPINPFWACDVRVGNPSLWLYGHAHMPNDTTIDCVRYVCNPHGYIHNSEPKNFHKQLFLEL